MVVAGAGAGVLVAGAGKDAVTTYRATNGADVAASAPSQHAINNLWHAFSYGGVRCSSLAASLP
jgi:hypothetical protein